MNSMTQTSEIPSNNVHGAAYVALSLPAFDDLCVALAEAPARAAGVSSVVRMTDDGVQLTQAQWLDALHRLSAL